ncbi:methyltransferase domain-containing protein [Nocardioides mangrovicus]|nr:methyltransferase domain-containing protein [Nocardioides mangrovicus]
MNRFQEGEEAWIERLGDLRNYVRQELIARQLEEHVARSANVLDIGCGQGTQAIRLAQRDCGVVGVDPSRELLERLSSDAAIKGVDVEIHQGRLEDLGQVIGDRTFDLVCAHGVLMYLDDPLQAVGLLAKQVAPGGRLSITFRNAGALAFRPGMRGQWAAALAAFESGNYVNELGVRAAAQHLDEVVTAIEHHGMGVERWYGVRVFTDPRPAREPLPDAVVLDALLAVEQQAGTRDPYRQLASQLHVVAKR